MVASCRFQGQYVVTLNNQPDTGVDSIVVALRWAWVLLILTGSSTGHPGDCDFDNLNDDRGYCGWRTPTEEQGFQIEYRNHLWQRKKSGSTGPFEDHTSLKGYFLLCKTSSAPTISCDGGGKCADFAGVVISKEIPATTGAPVCLQFWYFITGTRLNLTLFSYILKKQRIQLMVLKPRDDRSNLNKWLFRQITLNGISEPFHLVFQVLHVFTEFLQRDDAALDDIRLAPGNCISCRQKKWGPRCRKPCGNCIDNEACGADGLCRRCNRGYAQARCTWCTKTAYIPTGRRNECRPCGHCSENSLCTNGTGHCATGCSHGWKPPLCQECAPGFRHPYSKRYRRVDLDSCALCGHCLKPCDVRTGICPDTTVEGRTLKCKPGYLPSQCTEKCSTGKFGSHCQETCGQCHSGINCDHRDGTCEKCVTGYRPPLCKEKCQEGTWGPNCKNICGKCKGSRPCDFFTGLCENCASGKKMSFCTEDCDPGTYGERCTLKCGMCANNETCNPSTGECPKACEPGLYMPICLRECDDNFYGDCETYCGQCYKRQPCDKKTGHCKKCKKHFIMPLCKESTISGGGNNTYTEESASSMKVVAYVIGMSCIVVILVVFVTAGAFVMRRKRMSDTLKKIRINMSVPEGQSVGSAPMMSGYSGGPSASYRRSSSSFRRASAAPEASSSHWGTESDMSMGDMGTSTDMSGWSRSEPSYSQHY